MHKKGRENSNSDILSQSTHMAEAPPLKEEKYAEFYEVDEPIIRFEGGVNEIQYLQRSTAEIAEEQAEDEVSREVIPWEETGQAPEKAETGGKAREVLIARSMFDPDAFKMRDRVLMFTKAANRNWIRDVWRICLPEAMMSDVWSLCHQSDAGECRELEGTLKKFLKEFFMLPTRQKIHLLNSSCDTCLTK